MGHNYGWALLLKLVTPPGCRRLVPVFESSTRFRSSKGACPGTARSSGVAALHCADRLARLRCPWSLRLGFLGSLEPEFLGSVGSCVVVASRQGGKTVSTCLAMS